MKIISFANAEQNEYERLYNRKVRQEAKHEAEKRFLKEVYPDEYRRKYGEKSAIRKVVDKVDKFSKPILRKSAQAIKGLDRNKDYSSALFGNKNRKRGLW